MIKSIEDADLKGKIVLLRADLNVPTHDGKVSDTSRIDRLKPTIDHLASHGARTLIVSHFGRPKGHVVPDMSLNFLAPVLNKQWNVPVYFASNCIGDEAQKATDTLREGEFALLENVRFHAGEEQNDYDFAKALAEFSDVYVNDAFSAAHRAHASTEGITEHLPSYAGLLMTAELDALSKGLETPQKPVLAIVGGAKISTKLDLLNNLVTKTDYLVLGGGMANTFLAANGVSMGKSLCEHNMLDKAKEITQRALNHDCKLILPQDVSISSEFKASDHLEHVDTASIPDNQMALDVGPKSINNINTLLGNVKTVVWNGPLGAFELTPYDKGTVEVAKHLAKLSSSGQVTSVAGGGDTLSALNHAGVSDDFTYVSTAGGAFLEWLEGKTLPGVAALKQKKEAA